MACAFLSLTWDFPRDPCVPSLPLRIEFNQALGILVLHLVFPHSPVHSQSSALIPSGSRRSPVFSSYSLGVPCIPSFLLLFPHSPVHSQSSAFLRSQFSALIPKGVSTFPVFSWDSLRNPCVQVLQLGLHQGMYLSILQKGYVALPVSLLVDFPQSIAGLCPLQGQQVSYCSR